MADPVSEHPEGATLRLRVVPRAPRTAFSGTYADAIKLKVAAPPTEGAANAELRRFLAGLVSVRATDVELLRGDRSRDKVVLIRGVDAAGLRAVLPTRGVGSSAPTQRSTKRGSG